MIDCSFIENHQRHYALGTDTQPNHYFLCKFSPLLNATLLIGISTTYCPHSIVLIIVEPINVKKFLIWKENSHSFFYLKICSNPICKCFSVWSFDHWKAMLRLLSYRSVVLNRFSLFAEHFSRKYEGPPRVFELMLFSLDVNGVLPFEYFALRCRETWTSWWTGQFDRARLTYHLAPLFDCS